MVLEKMEVQKGAVWMEQAGCCRGLKNTGVGGAIKIDKGERREWKRSVCLFL